MKKNIYIYHYSADDTITKNCSIKWVTTLAFFLETMITKMTEEEIKIKLIDESTSVDLVISDMLIVILSQNFVQSQQAVEKLVEFDNLLNAEESKNINRVYKIFKNPINFYQQPKKLRKFLSYNFYDNTDEDDIHSIKNIDWFFISQSKKSFWMALTNLCYDITEIRYDSTQEDRRRYVYLADTGADLEYERLKIKRELQKHGFKVIPERYIVSDPNKFEEEVTGNLNKCEISIHLIGKQYGNIISQAEERSLAELENKYAAKFSKKRFEEKNNLFQRFVWLPPDVIYTDEKQKLFVDNLNRDKDELFGAERIESKIEDFKTILIYHLGIESDAQEEVYTVIDKLKKDENKKKIYLIADKRDIDNISTLKKWLEEQKFTVFSSSKKEDSKKSKMLHKEYLKICDSTIIYFQDAKREWLFTKLQDVLKANGTGRKNPLTINSIYTDKKNNHQWVKQLKEQYKIYRNILIMYNEYNSIEKTTRDFLQTIEKI